MVSNCSQISSKEIASICVEGIMNWYKVWADGTLMDIVCANHPMEAVRIVKSRNPDTDFTGIHWTYRAI